MTESDENLILERTVGGLTIRVVARPGESHEDLYRRLEMFCDEIRVLEKLRETKSRISEHFNLELRQLQDTGVTGDYERVILSLILNLNSCMGATDVAKEWGGINTGQVSRVFNASRKSTEKYQNHFEKCKGGGYRLTKLGIAYALNTGIQKLVSEYS